MTLITEKQKRKYLNERRRVIKEEYPYPKMICFENLKKYCGIVVVKDIEFSTRCQHHLVSIRGKAYIGYVPNNKLLPGLSQVARVVEYFLNPTTAITQEDANKQITDFIQKEAKPKGLIVVLKAWHDCISSRGIKQRNVSVLTSEIRGRFKDTATRDEFFKLLEVE